MGTVAIILPDDPKPFFIDITRATADRWSDWEQGIWRMWPNARIAYGARVVSA